VTLNSWSRNTGAHIVFLGVDRYLNPNQSIEGLLQKNSDLFSIAAHPLWEKSYEFKTTYLWQNRATLKSYFNAWECATGQHFSKEVYLSDLATVASSDFHGPTKFESWKTAAYLEEISLENLYDALKSKKTEPVWV
jgi:hypothetical protein